MSPKAQPAALAADRLHEIRLDRRAAAICDEGGDAGQKSGACSLLPLQLALPLSLLLFALGGPRLASCGIAPDARRVVPSMTVGSSACRARVMTGLSGSRLSSFTLLLGSLALLRRHVVSGRTSDPPWRDACLSPRGFRVDASKLTLK